MSDRPRVILAVPDFRECTVLSDWLLEDGLEPVRRPTAGAALEEMRARPFDLLIADADLAFKHGLRAGGRMRHPGIPTLVVGDAAAGRRCQAAGQWAMFWSGPSIAPCSCTVSMAILDARPTRRSGETRQRLHRVRQRRAVTHPRHQQQACASPCRERVVHRHFSVGSRCGRCDGQRMWALGLAATGQVMTCGGALASNRPSAEQAWRAFVQAVPAGSGSTTSLRAE
jgi:hypothetical protein